MGLVIHLIFGLARLVNRSEKISTEITILMLDINEITILVLDINEKLSEFIKIKFPYHTCLLLVNL